ncbi:TetR/AcrR family transcriptional regulator [Fodinicola feengrottensis]|uniref:TetR/AcrR family transcriptional regulator n=1 Tax=Fodinicola feengrottensis TaxID=435914 RepID=UPI002442DEF2|nr:helix-turn-helix domain containing protein [Fodinicola feengrottensis]
MVNESTRLSAQDWARAALKAMADGGLAAVAVEPLARTLGVTKGSFYAHYRSRDELIAAALAEWVRSHGDDGLVEFTAIADPARGGCASSSSLSCTPLGRWRPRCT